MTLISKLRSVLGLDDDGPHQGGTTVRVEREPDPTSERAVTEAVPSEPAEAYSRADDPVNSLSGIGPAYADRLAQAGVETVGELAEADPGALDEATDLGEGRLAGWIEQARDA